ncbi:hypothetical protein [uncultured Pseudodesulfovibrio sp.]|nr:hypothetical protein [uncultured Pseudodesulfovibrio sp.]
MKCDEKKERSFTHRNGVTYFTKQAERRVLFIMTLAMLAWGVVDFTKDLF